jgi:hypothetical protein
MQVPCGLCLGINPTPMVVMAGTIETVCKMHVLGKILGADEMLELKLRQPLEIIHELRAEVSVI